MKGFSRINLLYIRGFALAYPNFEFVQQLAGRLPWFHNCVILDKCKTPELRQTYLRATFEAGFAFVGNQYHLEVGGQDFYIELKAREFTPEDAGKLGFYLSAVDGELRTEGDNPSIGLLLCKTKNKLVAEYALKNMNLPLGVSEYQLIENLPKELKTSCPA
jgi:hypothetical protein